MLDNIKKIIQLIGMKTFRKITAMGIIAAIFDAVGVALIFPFMNLVDDPGLAHEKMTAFGFTHSKQNNTEMTVIVLGSLLVLFLTLSTVIRSFVTYFLIRFVWNTEHLLARQLLGVYLRQEFLWHSQNHSADLTKDLFNEINYVVHHAVFPLVNGASNFLIVLAIFVTLSIVEPVYSFILIGVILFVFSLTAAFGKIFVSSLGARRSQVNSLRFNVASEALNSAREVRLWNLHKKIDDEFSRASQAFAKYQAQAQAVGQIPRFPIELLAFSGIIFVIIFSYGTGRSLVEILPVLSFFAFAAYRLIPAMQQLYNSVTLIRYSGHSVSALTTSLEGVELAGTVPNKKIISGSIEVDNLSFGYVNGNLILDQVSFSVRQGESLAICGSTGAGKSTLLNLLLGLLQGTSGNVCVDGLKLTAANASGWQRAVGYVPQEIFIFDDTLAQNIALGCPDGKIDRERLKTICDIVCISDFFDMDLAYSKKLGERGGTLSGGQRQRVGIARALYKLPSVLILDEATSALDHSTEDKVLRNIDYWRNGFSKKPSLIVVTHNRSLLDRFNKTLSL